MKDKDTIFKEVAHFYGLEITGLVWEKTLHGDDCGYCLVNGKKCELPKFNQSDNIRRLLENALGKFASKKTVSD